MFQFVVFGMWYKSVDEEEMVTTFLEGGCGKGFFSDGGIPVWSECLTGAECLSAWTGVVDAGRLFQGAS